MESAVDLIKGKLSVKDVVSSYVKLEKAGINWKGRCPFHNERTPSFFVSPGRETFHCFGCGKGGDIFTFVEEIEGVEFREALKLLADRAGVNLESKVPSGALGSGTARLRAVMEEAVKFYQTEFTKFKKAQEYLKGRGVNEGSINNFRVGFAPVGWRNLTTHLKSKKFFEEDAVKVGLLVKSDKGYYDRFRGRVMFPFFDFSGRAIGFSARELTGVTDDNMGKYVNSPETPLFHKSKVFYGLERARQSIRENDKAILVEGQIDVIMAHQAGTENVVGVSGTAFTADHVDLLSRMSENLTVLLDADEAGFRASEKSVRLALSRGMFVRVVELPAGEDPASLIASNPELWKSALAKETSYVNYAISFIKRIESDQKRQSALQAYLYPHIADMYNEIEKDKAIQEVAAMLSVSNQAVLKDIEKWQSKEPERDHDRAAATGDFFRRSKDRSWSSEARALSSNVVMIGKRLYSIALLLESRKDIDSAKAIKEWLSKIINEPDFGKDEDLLFEAEMYYPLGQDLKGEIDSLKRRLDQELAREEFGRAMESLRMAEREGNEEKAKEWLLKCQEISKRMSPQL